MALATGYIVWINGPFPAGEWNNLMIARSALHDNLYNNEFYIADGGYKDGSNYSITPTGLRDYGEIQRQTVRARHETINGRLKQWACLKQTYHHNLQNHGMIFRSVANIIQMCLQTDRPSFQVEYDECDF